MITRYLFILLMLFCISAILFAEDKNQKTDEQKKSETVKPGVSKRAQVKTLEEFIPSEEVSADKPVAFPSDI